MKPHSGYQFLVCILLIALLQGCASPTTMPTATPSPVPQLYGIAYSPYRDCQSPDTADQPTLDDIKQDLQIIHSVANGIRTYSSTGINAQIPALARQMGLRVSAGAWLVRIKKQTSEKFKA